MEKAWEVYKVARREAKCVVREVKEAGWIRCGRQLQKFTTFLKSDGHFHRNQKRTTGMERKDDN